jgi:hypothetical protein
MEGERILMSKHERFVAKDQAVEDQIAHSLKRAKGDIVKEFEKVCPTDKSFNRVLKDVHDIFDELHKNIQQYN